MFKNSTNLETASEEVIQNTQSFNNKNNEKKDINPFKVPDDSNMYKLLNDRKSFKKQTRNSLFTIPLPRNEFKAFKTISKPEIPEVEKVLGNLVLNTDNFGKREGLREFISQKREIFLAKLAIDTKNEELERLSRLENEEQTNLKSKEGEINLFRDQFRNFLEFDGQSTMEARRSAEKKSKERIDLSMKIKQVSSQISALRNEIAHQDEKLQECIDYQKFLESLTPNEWRQKNPLPLIYFQEPKQLLNIFSSLEEQNMFLINHCQEAEETVERYRNIFNNLLNNRDITISNLILTKEEKEKELNFKKENNDQYKINGQFHHGNELTNEEYQSIQSAIINFHEQLGFDSTSSNDLNSMMKRIENKMEEMIYKLSLLPDTFVKELANEKEHHRREQDRAEKQIQQKIAQQEKIQKAITLANKPIKKKVGRPLMERMIPLKGHSRLEEEEKIKNEKAQEEADKELLFGQIWD